MRFSPVLLLRQPSYSLSHLNAFAIDLENSKASEDEIERLRKQFLTFIKSKHLLLSLPFSSKSLYNAIPHYEFHASISIRKKERQNERAFTKYLLRMVFNASPLADFASSQFCNWRGELLEPSSTYRLELSLAQRKEFFDLCYCDIGLQGIMRHRLNPSLTVTGDGVTYLFKEGSEEQIVELESDEKFEQLIKVLRRKDFTFAEFVEAYDYSVNEFLDAQIIVPSYPTYSDLALITEIIALINERFNLDFTVEEVQGMSYSELSDAKVLEIQSKWINKMSSYARGLDVNLDEKAYSERVFYLNSGRSVKNKPDFDKEAICSDLLGLHTLIQELSTFKSDKISLDNLYQTPEESSTSYALESVQVERNNEHVLRIILEENDSNEGIFEPVGVLLRHMGGKPFLVNLTSAYGKFFAPSLALANQQVHNELKQWVQDESGNIVVLKDQSLHNKNKGHDYLKEIDSFGIDFQSPIQDRVSIVVHNNRLHNQATAEQVVPFNLGIEDYRSRSSFYRNLFSFANPKSDISDFVQTMQKQYAFSGGEGIEILPRVETAQLILAWQKWIVPFVILSKTFKTGINENIQALHEWRKECGIPRLVTYQLSTLRPAHLDFYNPWSVDSFLRVLKKEKTECLFEEIGVMDQKDKLQVVESYFEFKV